MLLVSSLLAFASTAAAVFIEFLSVAVLLYCRKLASDMAFFLPCCGCCWSLSSSLLASPPSGCQDFTFQETGHEKRQRVVVTQTRTRVKTCRSGTAISSFVGTSLLARSFSHCSALSSPFRATFSALRRRWVSSSSLRRATKTKEHGFFSKHKQMVHADMNVVERKRGAWHRTAVPSPPNEGQRHAEAVRCRLLLHQHKLTPVGDPQGTDEPTFCTEAASWNSTPVLRGPRTIRTYTRRLVICAPPWSALMCDGEPLKDEGG